MPFEPGEKVVCIDADQDSKSCPICRGSAYSAPYHTGQTSKLQVGKVYTVRWSGEWAFLCGTLPAVKLAEHERDVWDFPYGAHRFRRAPSIEVFTGMLSSTEKELEDV